MRNPPPPQLPLAETPPHHPSPPPSRPTYPPPLIIPATRLDIHSITQITMVAEKSNLVTFLRYPTPQDEAKAQHAMIQALTRIWDNPGLKIMKAVDWTTRRIMAVGVWTLNGFGTNEGFGNGHLNVWKDLDELQIIAGGVWASPEPFANSNSNDEWSTDPLGRFISDECRKFLLSWAKPTKHMYLGLLMTDPRFQRRGIGTALLNWGHEVADEYGMPSFLIASPVGRPLYSSLGWREVEDGLSIDLREWTWSGKKALTKTEDHGFGTYKYYYMMRLPKSA